MKRLPVIFLVLFLSTLNLAQQDNYKTTALSFSFNGLNLSNYYGGVGGRWWLTDSTVFNLSIGGSAFNRKFKATEDLEEGYEKNTSFTFGIGMEGHLLESDNISPYYAFRGSFTLSNRFYKSSYDSFESSDKIVSYNIEGGFGVEYWIFKRISLSGQHLFNLRFDDGKRTTSPNTDSQDISGFYFGLGTTALILSIYF